MRILRLQVMRLGGKGQALTITTRSRGPELSSWPSPQAALPSVFASFLCSFDSTATSYCGTASCADCMYWLGSLGGMLRMWLHERSFARLSNDLHGGAWLRPSAQVIGSEPRGLSKSRLLISVAHTHWYVVHRFVDKESKSAPSPCFRSSSSLKRLF